jgi:CopG family nickel-responsive transcriptional regulator
MSARTKQSSPRAKPAKDYSTRVSISLPPKLLRELDEATRRKGYGERSKALQIAIRTFIDQSRVAESPDSYATGTILVLFDHTRRSVENITQFIHSFGTLVVSTLHVHLPEPNYLYVMVVRGKISDITLLEQHLRKLSGISQLKVSYLTTEPEEKPATGGLEGIAPSY